MKDNAIVKYVQEAFEELNKVTFPTKNQAIRLTTIVLGFTLVMAAFIAGIDYLFQVGFTEIVAYFKQNPISK